MTEPLPSPAEIDRLLAIARRELADAAVQGLSSDGRFEHSYGAALALATAVVRADRRRIHGADHHRLTFEALGEVADRRWERIARYLQHCRTRRNRAVYDAPGVVSDREASELREEVGRLKDEVEQWLAADHPDLRSSPGGLSSSK